LIFIFHSQALTAENVLISKIPQTIWQTYKTKTLSAPAQMALDTWTRFNPEYSHYLFDDRDIESYIREKWDPDYFLFFQSLPIGAMKADLWRYLILATEGGIYTDIDSICLLPIQSWPIPGRTTHSHVLILELDADQSHFCQWTFAASPKHPAMYSVCHYLLSQWRQRGILRNSEGTIDVLRTTGPIVFSEAIKLYIGEKKQSSAQKIVKRYYRDKEYRKKLNQMGIFFTKKKFFDGIASKNQFWGSWSKEAAELGRGPK
jgi:alpha 1,6-mannosyltransferase